MFDAFAKSPLGAFVRSRIDPNARGRLEEGDMPLTHAVWDAGRSKIFGVRGGWLFEFSAAGAATGRKLCFAEPIGDAFIALDSTRDKLVITNWWDPNINDQTDKSLYRKGFFLIDPDALTVFDFFPMAYMSAGSPSLCTPQPVPTADGAAAPNLSVDGYRSYVDVSPSLPPAALMEAGFAGTYSDHESIDPLVIGPFDQNVTVSCQLNSGWIIPADPAHDSSLPGDYQAAPFAQISGGGAKHYLTSYYTQFALTAGLTITIDIDLDLHDSGGFINFPGSAGTFLIVAGSQPTHTKNARYQCGPRCLLVMSDGKWFFTEIDSYLDGIDRLGRFDPGTLALKKEEGIDQETNNRDGHAWYDIWEDGATGDDKKVWVPNGRYFSYVDFWDSGPFGEVNKQVYSSPSAKMLCGMTFCDSNDKLYAATASLDIATCLKDSPYTTATFQLPSAPFRKPRRIRYSSANDRLYVPTLMDNCVIEIDPSDNSVTEIFEGFDVPYDIVITSAAVFAVQLGAKGLKKVKDL